MALSPIILLSGFQPFGGEKINPSWEIARRFDGKSIGKSLVEAIRLPVNCAGAARKIARAIDNRRPIAVIGLGQAGGRPALSLEKVAINLIMGRPDDEVGA